MWEVHSFFQGVDGVGQDAEGVGGLQLCLSVQMGVIVLAMGRGLPRYSWQFGN